jgi:DNA processing protein
MKHPVPWLTLKSVPEIGNLLFMRLVRHFGSPDKVLSAPAQALTQVEGISPRLADAIRRHRVPDWISREIDQAARKGYAIVTALDEAYPALLRQIPDPPPILFVHGRLEQPFCPIAVVGSRKATTYGRTTTHQLCAQLAERGATVISGMARGIDTAAHQGALAGGGRTIAVLGSGLNQVYPAENLKLFHQIAENGCVVSEFFMDAAPEPHHFPMRNRIISGMTLGTVVVEAARNSGSLITARLAAEQNREVFAVPGSIHAANAKGTHDLIKQGAKLVEEADDILNEIAPQLARADLQNPMGRSSALPPLSGLEQSVLSGMDVYPVHIDQLARRLKMQIGPLSSTLSQLELKGAIRQEPGKNFVRCKG